MGVSTNGEISFGIKFEEGFEFPWDTEKWKGDFEEWWYDVSGFQPSFYPYTPEGEYKPGVTEGDSRIKQYYQERDSWLKAHPAPVTLVNYCSGNYALYILAIPGSNVSCARGYPKSIDVGSLTVTDAERERLLAFCQEHGIEASEEPQWWLSSYYSY